jgi:hypothetical protein
MSSQSSSSGGIGFFGALALLFIGLKLAGVIEWTWLWVLSPIWMPFAFVAASGLVFLAVITVQHHKWLKRKPGPHP